MPAPSLLAVTMYSFLPVATTAAGAAYAALRPPSAQLRSIIQHFAAGVVFSVVAVELLPDVTRVHDLFEIGWTFALGVVLMLVIRRVTDKQAAPEAAAAGGAASVEEVAESSAGALVGVGVDILIDGILVGIAFAAGSKEGVLLSLALGLELLSLGLAIAAGLAASGGSRARTILIPTGLSLLLVVGAVVGDTVLRDVSPHVLAGVLSFGCAALLFLVTEELLVEAHEAKETTTATAMFFAGFLLFLLLGMAGE